MRQQPTEDRDILVRAITAAARELGAKNPLFPKAVEWFVDNVPALVGLFGEDSQMYWEIKYLRDPSTNRDDHIAAVMSRYGFQLEDLDNVRRRYDRWQKRCEGIFNPSAPLAEVLFTCLRHLYPPPHDPHGDTETFYF